MSYNNPTTVPNVSPKWDHLFLTNCWVHFTNKFCIIIQIWWTYNFDLIQILIKWSLPIFAHDTTAMLLCHMQKLLAMWWPVMELQIDESPMKFELSLKFICEMGACLPCFHLNTLRPRQNGRHFPDDIFKRIFLNQNVRIPINISLKFVPKGPINNIPALVQIMAWRHPGDKPSSETVLVSLLTNICITRPQWVEVL